MTTYPVALRALADLSHDPRNARTHDEAQIEQIAASILEFGFTAPVAADREGIVRAGNGRLDAVALIYGRGDQIKAPDGTPIPEGMIPAIDCSSWTEDQCRAYALADNRIALNAGWNQAVLDAEIAALAGADFDISLTGFDADEIEASMKRMAQGLEPEGAGPAIPRGAGSLSREFLIPPFSVLSAREGWWQERKRQWLALGIQSEVGRGDNLLQFSDTLLEPDPDKRAALLAKRRADANPGGGGTNRRGRGDGGVIGYKADGSRKPGEIPGGLVYGAMNMADGSERTITGTSIFDPVLCEIAYRWFSPKGGIVLDPFAGGSVRGIVAATLGRRYIGIDLRDEQIEANEAQWADILPRLPDIEGADHPEPDWRAGDSNKLLPINRDDAETELADFIFSCPPYGDLEVYSDRPDDISNMAADDFDLVYAEIIKKAVESLKQHRFACFVIGDYRDRNGLYRNLPGKTIAAFEAAGASLYNEAILVTATGSLAIRAGKSFRTTRKLGKTHQNVLVFVKGDPRLAVADLGQVDISAAPDISEAVLAENEIPSATE